MMFEGFQNKALDDMSWAILGTEYSLIQKEEIAFECFHMSHLINHTKWKTNSDLPLDTYMKKKSKEDASLIK